MHVDVCLPLYIMYESRAGIAEMYAFLLAGHEKLQNFGGMLEVGTEPW